MTISKPRRATTMRTGDSFPTTLPHSVSLQKAAMAYHYSMNVQWLRTYQSAPGRARKRQR